MKIKNIIKGTMYGNKTLFALAFLLGAMSMTAMSASAWGGDPTTPRFTDEQKIALEQARTLRESGDFDGAKALLTANNIAPPMRGIMHGRDRPDRPELTDAQKAILDQARELHQQGDHDGAKSLLEANGLKPPFHHHMMGQNKNLDQ